MNAGERKPSWTMDSRCWLNVNCGPSSPSVIFLLIVSTFIALSATRYMTNVNNPTLPLYVVQAMGIVLMSVGFVVQLVFCRLVSSISFPREDRSSNTVSSFISDNLVLFGIVPFFAFDSLLDLAKVIAEVECWDAWNKCADHDTGLSHHSELFFHICRVLFGGSTMLFCCSFHRTVFRRCVLVTHGFALLGAAVVSLWFDTMCNEMMENLRKSNGDAKVLEMCVDNLSWSSSNATTDNETVSCWQQSTSIYNWTRDGARYMDPFSVEFLLLVCHCLLRMFVGCRSDDFGCYAKLQVQVSPENLSNLPSEFGSISRSSRDTSMTSSQIETESSRLVGSSNSCQIQQLHQSVTSDTSAGLRVFMTCAVIANLVYCLLTFLSTYTSTDDVDKAALERAKNVYRIIYYFSHCVVVAIGLLSNFPVRLDDGDDDDNKRYGWQWSGLEYLVLITSVGPFIYLIMTAVAYGRGYHVNEFDRVVNVTKEMFNIVEVMMQTVFLFYVKNVDFNYDERHTQRTERAPSYASISEVTTVDMSRFQMMRNRFKAILVVLTLTNATLWLINSFVDIHVANSSFQNSYFSEWITVLNVVAPITIFYRFNCVMLLFGAYLNTTKHFQSRTGALRIVADGM